jgi:uncharacterized membrane protein YhaH (DUF805 family)
MFVLVNLGIVLALTILSKIVGILAIVTLVYDVAVLIPGMAAAVRRMHDVGKSGRMLLVASSPSWADHHWWLAAAGDLGEKQYGPASVDGMPAFA